MAAQLPGAKRRAGKRRADGGNAGAPPGDVRGVERKIEADHAHVAALGEHLKKQAAAAADVENQALLLPIRVSARSTKCR